MAAEHIGALIRDHRLKAKLSAGELAKRVIIKGKPIHRSYISKLENKGLLPSPEIFIQIIIALELNEFWQEELKYLYMLSKFPYFALEIQRLQAPPSEDDSRTRKKWEDAISKQARKIFPSPRA